jgi:hypothetical protein
MLRFTRLVPTFTLALLASRIRVPAAASQGEAPGPPSDTLAVTVFEDVNLVPMDRERVLEGQSVVIRGDRIAEIGARTGVRVPAGARRIDGRGKYLMPGIAEMHAHVPARDDPVLETVMALYVLTRATTVRAMMGTPDQLEYRRRIAAGEMLGPTLLLVGPPFSGKTTHGPEDARGQVREYHAAGFDVLKIYPGLTRAEYDAILGTARELHMPVSGHVPSSIDVRHAIASGQSIEHLDGYLADIGGDRRRIPELVRMTVEGGIWNTPTMDVWKTILGLRDLDSLRRERPEVQYLPHRTVDGWVGRCATSVARIRCAALSSGWGSARRPGRLRRCAIRCSARSTMAAPGSWSARTRRRSSASRGFPSPRRWRRGRGRGASGGRAGSRHPESRGMLWPLR